ncbi:DUF5691 domain-containing protein [Streptomyces orinoci]|uniref:DUF5691 domain-containing protein n=1 Tax=Streptomyces orinoci TaxID=67339 RepID=A0ABV3JUC5_STRON|nr:DUF5691 domain-containing protein [Streptomyces orinoci]
MHTTTWDELLSTALLGTDRRAAPAGRPGQAPALALLDEAALHAVRRRAGALPAAARARPEPAPEDPRPCLPEAARRRLALLLADRAGPATGRRGSAPDLVELLPQWLAAANLRGYRAPDALLPELLDAARARSDLRQEVLRLGGERARWLARLNPQWKFALRARPAEPAGSGPADRQRVWREGLFAERSAVLATLRRQNPDAARELLAGTWASERAEDRLMFLDSFHDGLRPADEPFLEAALADRSRNVRALAARLLTLLPESALAARMARRARACVSRDRLRGAGPLIVVEAPHECDAAMQRDGVVVNPPSGRGERSWWLGQIVEAAPLSVWPAHLGVSGAAGAVALPVADGWRQELHAAWCRAAVQQRDTEWSRALLGPATAPPGPGESSWRDPAKLLTALPRGERAEWVAQFIATHGLPDAFRMIGVCEVPWAGPLGRAVIDALDIARESGGYPWSFSGVMGLAERCLDPDQADRLQALVGAPDQPEHTGSSPGAFDYWTEAFQRLVDTLRLRAVMRAELEP